MRIAVVTPYFEEPAETLLRCHASVLGQVRPGRHVLVADGRPHAMVGGWEADHIVLPRAHADCGNVARGIGAMAAIGDGHDAIAFLDADNWYRPDHLETLARRMTETGALVCASARSLHADDGTLIAPLDPGSDGRNHVDTNTLMVHRRASDLLAFWCALPHDLAAIGDRLFLAAARARGHAIAYTPEPTVAYCTRWAYHYRKFGLPAPPDLKQDSVLDTSASSWRALSKDERKRILLGRS